MKTLLKIVAALLAVIIAIGTLVWNSRAGQDWLLELAVDAAMNRPSQFGEFDGLRVFFCGTSSPLPDPSRAQACIAILAGDAMYLVDTGAGSARVAALAQLPLERLENVFLTHFHSDHIAALPDFNLNSWVAGRSKPLSVYGPNGVSEVVDGFNAAHHLDRSYRVAHHGAELLDPAIGAMRSVPMDTDTTLTFGELEVSSFEVDHDPVRPAVGYRFDYRGRSVVISGDSVVTDSLTDIATGADLLLHDALSLPIVQGLERGMAGSRMEHILLDIQNYHAHTSDLDELVADSGVKQLILYHLVPPPGNALFEKIFARDVPEGTVISIDGMIVELPAGSESIDVIYP